MSELDGFALGVVIGLIYLELRRIRKCIETDKQVMKDGDNE